MRSRLKRSADGGANEALNDIFGICWLPVIDDQLNARRLCVRPACEASLSPASLWRAGIASLTSI
jgi:hypothetical protein